MAIARKLLVAVWYVLQGKTDKYAEPEAIARKMLKFAYQVGKDNRPKRQTAAQFARVRLDTLGLEEAHPITALSIKRKERCLKQKIV